MIIVCAGDSRIVLTLSDEDFVPEFKFPDEPLEFIGIALHAIQQGCAESLKISGNKIDALLIDQTGGAVISLNDIYLINKVEFRRIGSLLS